MKGMRIQVERVGQSLALLFVVLMMQGCRTGGTEIVNMQCEYQNHPIGIDTQSPRFTWNYAGDTTWQQSAFRIILADSPKGLKRKGEGFRWESPITQSSQMLTAYEELLQRFGATLADNCIRTWFYVRDVDTQYAGMVRARRENFIAQGLTPETHYISSTGIGGLPADTRALVQLGTYALVGFQPEQQHYLYAKTHLNPTYEYGVTFERGTRVDYGDRRHVYISGTASINNKGEVMYVGDIVRQTHRMWKNVEALLAEADTTFDDIAHIIVYLRDISDYAIVSELFRQRFPQTPYVITHAPVCRPTWLIEMECVAIKEKKNPEFREF